MPTPIAQHSLPTDVTLTPARAEIRVARLTPLDTLRGVIMIVMALDHANFFIAHQHPRPETWTGPLPYYDSALAFFTRSVTHLAAPGFFFLMGAGMTLLADSRRRLGWTRDAIVRHLIVRGLILIALQFLVEDPVWPLASTGRLIPPWSGGSIYFGVLYALGGGMIVGALLLRLDSKWLIGISAAAVLATQVLFPDLVRSFVPLSPALHLLLVPGDTRNISVLYPVIPWLSLMGFGLVFGRWLLEDRARAYRRALRIGIVFILAFIVLRAWNGFGNIRPAEGPNWIDFLNVVKYPPSLVFILLALGTDLILLAGFARASYFLERWGQPLQVFGSSPLLFYIAHLYLYGVIGRTASPQGTSLAAMYPVWLLGLIILYPLCWAFGKFKRRQSPNSPWRFF